MRLFTAIVFKDSTLSKLLALRDELSAKARKGNFTLNGNLHLTLLFLGECDRSHTAAAASIVKTLEFEPFDIVIDRVGCFRRNGGDVWWAGLRDYAPLIEVWQRLKGKFIDGGFYTENDRYSPHITLGREVVTDAKPWKLEPFGEKVDSVKLMKSERIGGKLTYSVVS